jgi:uncharacterized membrane protein
MEPVFDVLFASLVFGTTHIVLATAPIRTRLVARLGTVGFTGLFSLVAAVAFGWLVHTYAVSADAGAAGPALGAQPWLRWPLVAIATLGMVGIVGSFLEYPDSAYFLSTAGQKPEPRGLERITRHPFMVGLAMVSVAHALLSTRLTGTVFFLSLAVIAIAGSMHQDVKLRARNPELHGAFVARSSLIPFAAIMAGRNRLVFSELPLFGIALGLIAAWGVRQGHPHIFADGGIYVIAVTVGGALLAGAQDLQAQARKRAARAMRQATEHDSSALPRACG